MVIQQVTNSDHGCYLSWTKAYVYEGVQVKESLDTEKAADHEVTATS